MPIACRQEVCRRQRVSIDSFGCCVSPLDVYLARRSEANTVCWLWPSNLVEQSLGFRLEQPSLRALSWLRQKEGRLTTTEPMIWNGSSPHLDTQYEEGEECIHPDTEIIVTDGEYDALRRELKNLRPDSPLFDTATASSLYSENRKIAHDPPMTSIEKASHEDIETQEEMLFKWIADSMNNASDEVASRSTITIEGKRYKDEPVTYANGYLYQTYKLDGVAIGIYYEEGRLVAAGLRPRDGINGEDVTEQVKFVDGIPTKLNTKVTCSIRGELICTLSDFKKVQIELEASGEKLRANPRNHAAGGIRQFKNPEKTRDMKLSFVAYGIERLDNPPYKTEVQRYRWCTKELGVPFVETKEFDFDDLEKMEKELPNLDFEVDGVIIGVNNLEDQEQLGRHGDRETGNPKGKIACNSAAQRCCRPVAVGPVALSPARSRSLKGRDTP